MSSDNKEDDEIGLDEYEDRFNEIDSELEALRTSILDDGDSSPSKGKGRRKKKKKPETGGSSLAPPQPSSDLAKDTTLQTSLAEQSAAEMEKIVRTLQEQQQQQQQDGGDNGQGDAATTPSATTTQSSSPNSSSRKNPIFIGVFIVIPILLGVGWRIYQDQSVLSPSSLEDDTNVVSVVDPKKNSQRQQQKHKVERCKYVNGQKYCESEEHSTTTSGNDENNEPILQHSVTFQKCAYVNGESYCESYTQEGSGGQQQQQDQGRALGNGDATTGGSGASSSGLSKQESREMKRQIRKEFIIADLNNDGYVNFEEFDFYKQRYLKQYPKDASTFANFEDFDTNNDGFITPKEHEGYYIQRGLL